MAQTQNEPADNSYTARRARYRRWLIRKAAWGCAKLLAVAVFFVIGLAANSIPLMFLIIPAVLLISLAEILVERRIVNDLQSDERSKQ